MTAESNGARVICLRIAYDGTDFVGWQVQPTGVSVQQLVEDALARILGQSVRLHSSGRTDAGVHARGMMAHFQTERDLPLSAFREGANRFLPPTVAVQEALEMPSDFHARFDACGKWYRYSIYQGPVRHPLHSRFSWQLRQPLDIPAMGRAATAFVGSHDFASFRSSSCDAKTTVREIFSIELIEEGPLLHIDVRGGGFLKNMVRVMVGTLVEIGQGRRPEEEVTLLLKNPDRTAAGQTAPPQGLCLMSVWYEPRDIS